MKYNKVLDNVNVSKETKRYVNNYINESINLMRETGEIKEFIWMSIGFTDDVNLDVKFTCEILELIKANIITFGNYNKHNVLIPLSKDYAGEEVDGFIDTVYMLSDHVLLKNGFKNLNIKEENV